MVDMVIKRHDIPEMLARLLKILTKKPAEATSRDSTELVLPIAVGA
jgi:acetyl-CoA carboxylase carboxyl transferase subunit beta